MTIPTRIVTAHFDAPDNTPYANVQFSYRLVPGSFTAGSVVLSGSIPDITDGAGDASTVLWTNAEGMRPCRYTCLYPNGEQSKQFVLPAGDTPISLDELLALQIQWGVPDIEDLLDARDASIYGALANTADPALGDELIGAKLTNDGIATTVHDVLDAFDDQFDLHQAAMGSQPASAMSAASAIAATSVSAFTPPIQARVGTYVVIDAFTPDAEPRKIASIVGNTITFASGLAYVHGINDSLIYVTDNRFYTSWFGIKSDGTDESTAVMRAITAIESIGGTLVFPSGITRWDSYIRWPDRFEGDTAPRSRTVRLTGQGGYFNGRTGTSTGAGSGSSILDMRYNNLVADPEKPAKIDLRGSGLLVMDNLIVTDYGGGGNTPFFQTTNTTLLVHDCGFIGSPSRSGTNCDQDVWVLGGTNASAAVVGGVIERDYNDEVDAPFQGYGTVIRDCHFNRVRRAILMQDDVNGILISGLHIQGNSGSNIGDAAAAIDLQAGIHTDTALIKPVTSNKIAFCLIEQPGYTVGIALRRAINTQLISNDFYDTLPAANANIQLDNDSRNNLIIQGWGESGDCPGVLDNTTGGGGNTIITSQSNIESKFQGPIRVTGTPTFETSIRAYAQANNVDIQPLATVASENTALFRMRRSAAQATPGGSENPSAIIATFAMSGLQTWQGASAGNETIKTADGATTLQTVDQNGKRRTLNGSGGFEWSTGGGSGGMIWRGNAFTMYANDLTTILFNFLASGQLRFGSDQGVNLYPVAASASNQLKTDDQFIAVDGITTRQFSGAGRTTVADGDFTATPANGTIAILHNTTDSTSRIAVRVNGGWKYIAVT